MKGRAIRISSDEHANAIGAEPNGTFLPAEQETAAFVMITVQGNETLKLQYDSEKVRCEII